jgi:hypothetical protein
MLHADARRRRRTCSVNPRHGARATLALLTSATEEWFSVARDDHGPISTRHAMASDESGREPSFKVQDRRRFSATGDVREDAAEESPSPSEPSQVPPPPTSSEPQSASDTHDASSHEAAGEITFASFVFSLSTQALVHLGEVPDPIDGTAHTNLEAARQIIDILAILAEKRGQSR